MSHHVSSSDLLASSPFDLFEVFTPRRICMRLEPDIIWVHFTADLLTAFSYFSIPFALVYLVHRRKDLAINWMVLLFALFIVLCGTTHLFSILSLWMPLYRLDGYVKLATGVVSIATAILLWRLIPQALKIPSPDDLKLTNEKLAAEVTERKRVEENLAILNADLENRVRLRTTELESLLTSAPLGVAFFDREHRYVRINNELAAINGISVAEHLGRRIREVLPAKNAPSVEAYIDRVFATGEAIGNVEVSGETPKQPGLQRHWLTGFYPVRDAQGQIESVGLWVTEISARKQQEELLRLQDRRKDEFLATLAHELRNPLAPLRNGLEILRYSDVGHPHAQQVRDMMERQLLHLVRLVDDLLDISRVNRDKITLRREVLSIAEAVHAAVESVRSSIDEKHHTLELLGLDQPLYVEADRTRLVQILINLLANAAKYTEPHGRITITIQSETQQARIAIRDSGVGIPPEDIPSIWDMFTQVRNTLDKAQGGLGIGLSLVRKLVEMHGGTIAAESLGPGQGCTFTLSLPRVEPPRGVPHEPELPSSPASTEPEPRHALSRERTILVVDDNQDGAESLSLMLEIFGYKTRLAHDGPTALALAAESAPHVVFCDIGLPGMDGYEVARRLAQHPLRARMLLVALTGWGSEEHKQRSREAGFDHHLTKPVEVQALEDLLRTTGIPS